MMTHDQVSNLGERIARHLADEDDYILIVKSPHPAGGGRTRYNCVSSLKAWEVLDSLRAFADTIEDEQN